MRGAGLAVLCAGVLLLTGCAKKDVPPAELQAGWLDLSGLNGGTFYENDLTGSYEMADENAAPPVDRFWRCTTLDGEMFLFDESGRLRSYTIAADAADAEQVYSEEELHGICDEVLSSYIADYEDFTEITTAYYNSETATYNLAKEHKIAEGISDYALVRVTTQGEVHDLNIMYADSDNQCDDTDFVTDSDKAYFEKKVQPYLTALSDYTAQVQYISYKHTGGKLYAFYEVTYTDPAAGIEAGSKKVIFVK